MVYSFIFTGLITTIGLLQYGQVSIKTGANDYFSSDVQNVPFLVSYEQNFDQNDSYLQNQLMACEPYVKLYCLKLKIHLFLNFKKLGRLTKENCYIR
jgi:hypothetical protein